MFQMTGNPKAFLEHANQSETQCIDNIPDGVPRSGYFIILTPMSFHNLPLYQLVTILLSARYKEIEHQYIVGSLDGAIRVELRVGVDEYV